MAKLAEYLFDGAASGTTPTTVSDTSGNGNGLTINFNTDDGAWGENSEGRYLSCTEVANTSPMVARVAMNAGALGADLQGATQFLIFIKTQGLGPQDGGGTLAPLVAIGAEGSAAVFEIFVGDGGSGVSLFVNAFGGEAGFYDYTSTIMCLAVDTTQATANNRLRWYRRDSSGTNEAITPPAPFYAAPAQNAALASINNGTTYLSVLNYADGSHNATGGIKYLRFESGTLTQTQIFDAFDALAADDDADPLAPPPSGTVNLMAGKFGALLAGKL